MGRWGGGAAPELGVRGGGRGPFQTAVRGDGLNSMLRKEKPWKSSWLMAARISGSDGVSTDGAAVKNLSKFSPFFPPCGEEKEKEKHSQLPDVQRQ